MISKILSQIEEAPAGAEQHRQRIEEEQRQRDHRVRVSQCVSTLKNDLGARYLKCTLDNFDQYDDAQKAAVDRLRSLSTRLSTHIQAGGGLFLYGPPGTGKDHLAVALLKQAALAGFSCRWVNAQSLFGDIAEAWQGNESVRRIVEELNTPDVVCLSDPVIAGMTDSNLRTLYRIVNFRYRLNRPTWVTLNVAGSKDAPLLLGSQTYSRLVDGAVCEFCSWPDYRLKRRAR